MIRVMVVDDHAIVRAGLKQILSECDDIEVTGESSNGEEALKQLGRQEWDLVLLDMLMPGKSGMEVLKVIKHNYPNLPVLILSMHPEKLYAMRVLKEGAAGYLTKDSAPDLLIGAIKWVANGKRYISSELADSLSLNLQGTNLLAPHQLLRQREYDIFSHLIESRNTTEIAQKLSLSSKTVCALKSNILRKMKAKGIAELIVYAEKHDLLGQKQFNQDKRKTLLS